MEISLEEENTVDENHHRFVIQELAKFNVDPHPQKVNVKITDLSNLWEIIIKNPNFSTYLGAAFLQLYRATVVTVLHPDWSEGASSERKNHLLKTIEQCGDRLVHTIGISVEKCRQLIALGNHPWGDLGVDWNNLVNGKLDYEDPEVQDYLNTESADLVLGRIHFLASANRPNLALCLARYLFMYVNRKRMKKSKSVQELPSSGNQTTNKNWIEHSYFMCALNWMTSLLKNRTASSLVKEVEMLTCHDGLQLIFKFLENGTEKSRFMANKLINIFLVRDIENSKDYCCTRDLFLLWCYSMKHYSMHQATVAVRDLLGYTAKNSAQFYVCADVFYGQFQTSFLPLYVELFIRGLTIDINFLDVVRSQKEQSKIEDIERHLAIVFDKLSTLFCDLSDIVERECVLSAFSLRPNKDRLYLLQSLTHCILSDGQFKNEWERELIQYDPGCSKYSCGQKCSNVCMQKKKLFHPLLTKGIKNIPYSLVKDLVIVLESVRCNTFQFNYFDWETAVTEFGDYLEEYSKKSAKRQLQMDYDSDTDCASDGSNSPISHANRKREYYQASTSKSPQNVYQNGHSGSLVNTGTECMNLSITNSSIPYVAETIEIETEDKNNIFLNINKTCRNSSKLGRTNSKRKEPNHQLNMLYENKEHGNIAKKYDNFFKSSAITATVFSQNAISKTCNDNIAAFSEQKYFHSTTSPSTSSALAIPKHLSLSCNLQEKKNISEHYLGNQKHYLKGNNAQYGSYPVSRPFSQSTSVNTSIQTASNPRSSHISDIRLYDSMPKKQFVHNNLSVTTNNSRLSSTLEGLGSPYRLMPSIETPNRVPEKRKMDNHFPSAGKHSPLEKRFVQDTVTTKPFDEISGKHSEKTERLHTDYSQPQNQSIHAKNIIQSEISLTPDMQLKSGTPIDLNTHKIEFTLSNSKGTQCNHPPTSFHSPPLYHSNRANVAKVSPIVNYDQKHTANSSLVPSSKDQSKIQNQDLHGRNSVIQHTMQIQKPVPDKQINLLPSEISVSLPSKNEEMGIVNPLSVKVSNNKLLSGRDGYINAQLLISCPKGDKPSAESQANSEPKCETTCIPGIIYVRNKAKKLNIPGANVTHSNDGLSPKTNFANKEIQVSDFGLNKVVKNILSSHAQKSISKTTSLNSNQQFPCVTEPLSDIGCGEQTRNSLTSIPATKSNSTPISTSSIKSFHDKSVQMYNNNSHQSVAVSQYQQINGTFPSSTYQSWSSENVTSRNAEHSFPKPVVLPTLSSEQGNLEHYTYSRQQQKKLTEPVINPKTSLRGLLSTPAAVNPIIPMSKSYVPNNTASINSNVAVQSFSNDNALLPTKQEQTKSFVSRSVSSSPICTTQDRKIPISLPEKQHISNTATSSASNINIQNFENCNLPTKQKNQNFVRGTVPATFDYTVMNRNVPVVSTPRQDYVSNNLTSLSSTVSSPKSFIDYSPSEFSKQQQNGASAERPMSSNFATNHKKAAIPIHHVTKVQTSPINKVPSNSYSSSIGSHTSTSTHMNLSSHNMTNVPSPPTPMLTSVRSNDEIKKHWPSEPFQNPMNSTIAAPTSMCCSPHEIQKCQTCKEPRESRPPRTPVFDHMNMPAVNPSFHDENVLSPSNPEEQMKDHNEKQDVSSKKKYKKPPLKCDYCDKYLGTRYTLKQHIYNIHSGQNKRRKKRNSFIMSDSNVSPSNSRMQSFDLESVFVKTEPSDELEVKYNQETNGDQNLQFENQTELDNIFDQYDPNFFTNFPEQELMNSQAFAKPESKISSEKLVRDTKNENILPNPEQPASNPMDIQHTSSKPCEGNLSAMLTNSALSQQTKKDSNLETTVYDAELESPWQVAGAAMRYLSDPSYTNVDEQFFSEFQSNFDSVPEEGSSFNSGESSVPNNSYPNSTYSSNPVPVSNNSSLYHKNVSTALDNFQLNDFFQDSQTPNVMENQNWQHVDPKFLQHKCAICGKDFSSEETLRVHINSIHGNLGQMPDQSFYSYDNMFPANLTNPADLKPMPNFPALGQQEYDGSALHHSQSKPESDVPSNNNFFAPTFDTQFTNMSTHNSYNALPKSYKDSSFSSRISNEISDVASFTQMSNNSVLSPNDKHICHICDSKFSSYDVKKNHIEQIHGVYLQEGQEDIDQSFNVYPGTKQVNESNQFSDFASKFCENHQNDELSAYNPSLSSMLSFGKNNYPRKQPHLLIDRKSPSKDEYIPNQNFVQILKSPDKITSPQNFSNRSAHVNSPILASVLSSPYVGNRDETIKIKTEPIDEMDTHLSSVLTGKNSYTLNQKGNSTKSREVIFTLDLSCHICVKKLASAGHKRRHMIAKHQTEWPSTPEEIEAFKKRPKLRNIRKEKTKTDLKEKISMNTAVHRQIVEPRRGVKKKITALEKNNSRNSFYPRNRKSSVKTNLSNQNQVTPISSAERRGSPYPMPVLSPVPVTTNVVSTSSVPPGLPKIDALHAHRQNTRIFGETPAWPNNQSKSTYLDQTTNKKLPANTTTVAPFGGFNHSSPFKDSEAPPFSKMLASMAKGNNVFKKDALNRHHFVETSQAPTIVKVPYKKPMPLGKNAEHTDSSDYGNSSMKGDTEDQIIKVFGKPTVCLNKELSISQSSSMLEESSCSELKPYGSSTDRLQNTVVQHRTFKNPQLPSVSQATLMNQRQPPHIVHTNPKFITRPKLGYKNPAVKLLRLDIPTTVDLNKIKTEGHVVEAGHQKTDASPWHHFPVSKIFPPMRKKTINHPSSASSLEIPLSEVNKIELSEELKNKSIQETITSITDVKEASSSGKNRIANAKEKCTKKSARPSARKRASNKNSKFEMINPEDIKKEFIENDTTDAENITNTEDINMQPRTSSMLNINKSSCPKIFLQKIKSSDKDTKFQCYVPKKKRQKSIENSVSDVSLLPQSVDNGTIRASTRCMVRLDRLKIAEKGVITKETGKKGKRKTSANSRKKAELKSYMPSVKTRPRRQITNKKMSTYDTPSQRCKVLVEKVIPDQSENRELKRSSSIEEIIEIPRRKRSERIVNRPIISRKERRRSSRLKEGSLLRKRESYLDDENTSRSPIDIIIIDD